MQFVRHGPDIPERLLQWHENGRVVFFCGAGISYPAGLPGFSDLVKRLYQDHSVTPNPVQQYAIEAKQFDTAIGLLEADIVGGREAVRRSLATILTPDFQAPNATATHEALLTLARNRESRTRLITTNFDRLFEEVRAAKSLSFPVFKAPLLSKPKNRWDGLVYLHGLLPDALNVDDLDRLVVSSGDFGLAYLTEGWAARFVSELFRNFTVCFVGYSISDPVLRYMMDALAADRLLGESPPEIFAFGSYSEGKEAESASEWKAKNVTPILYHDHQDHAYLHETLRAWADIYRDGVRGKENIVVECAARQDDDYSVGRMLWALSDPGGLPAKRFAERDPVPSLDWLGPLNTVISQLPRWLIRHLDDPKLLIWVIKRGDQLHDELVRLIEDRLHELDELDRLANAGDTAELDRIRASAPNAIPGPEMKTFWRLLCSGHVKSRPGNLRLWSGLDLHYWREQFMHDGPTVSARSSLRKILTPCVSLRESRWHKLEVEVVLASDDVHDFLCDLSEDKQWKAALPELLDDFSALLRDALDLMRDLGENDRSHSHQPSISDHPQNRDFHDWTALIQLTRDAWLATAAQSPERARIMAETWTHAPYPVFRRLALFAATRERIIPLRQALDWLLADERRWLWSHETRRETMRLLVSLAPQLDATMLAELEQAILSGPPRDLLPWCGDDGSKHLIWLRLAKMAQAGAILGEAGRKRFDTLSAQYPSWQPAPDESDEFSTWMDWMGDATLCQHTRRSVPAYRVPERRWQFSDWRKRCSEMFEQGLPDSIELIFTRLETTKPMFLDTVDHHYAQLHEDARQGAMFLTSVALDPNGIFTIEELTAAFRALPADGLRDTVQALVLALRGAGEQREEYWKNRVLPFWKKIWPKSKEQASQVYVKLLVILCVEAGGEFPSAVATVGKWLRPVPDPDNVVRRLQESGLPARFPGDALRLLVSILDDQPQWLPPEPLRQCLDDIGQTAPHLRQDDSFKKLDELARRFET